MHFSPTTHINGQVLRLTGTVELKTIRPQTIDGSILNNSVRVFTTEIIHGATSKQRITGFPRQHKNAALINLTIAGFPTWIHQQFTTFIYHDR